MKKIIIEVSILFIIFLFGYVIADNDPYGSKTKNGDKGNFTPTHHLYKPTGSIVYSDSMNGVNDSAGLVSRGYFIYNRGTNRPGLVRPWFQGNPLEFTSYEGPPSGYVASNFNSVTGTSDIDNWLILPVYSPTGIYQGDSLFFYARSVDGSTFPDSMRVMYSDVDTVPEGNWTDLGRFKVSTSGWELKAFSAPASSLTGRFAIRYAVVNGGPNGQNSDYVGIDDIIIKSNGPIGIRNTEINLQLRLDQNYPNPYGPITNIIFKIKENEFVSLKIYDINGRLISTLINGKINAGEHNITFNPMNLPAGIYFYKLTAGEFSQVKKMVVVK